MQSRSTEQYAVVPVTLAEKVEKLYGSSWQHWAAAFPLQVVLSRIGCYAARKVNATQAFGDGVSYCHLAVRGCPEPSASGWLRHALLNAPRATASHDLRLTGSPHLLEQPSSQAGRSNGCRVAWRRAEGQAPFALLDSHHGPFSPTLDERSHLPFLPTAVYGCILPLAAIAYHEAVQLAITPCIKASPIPKLRAAVALQRARKLSIVLHTGVGGSSFANVWLANRAVSLCRHSCGVVPDRRIEKKFELN